ncbi:hypothetical protein [Pontibacter chitinilyticus]|uniref:NADH-quinone oxidoreductase subunit D-related protein n=1 Tax=Pontibacter chitinilyticus TaxID=2674989 RepID=UPI00321AB472
MAAMQHYSTTEQMKTGARKGAMRFLRRLLAKAAAHAPVLLVVPGAEVARTQGWNFEAASIAVADSPREANALLVLGPLSAELVQHAAVAYAQMPRPRVLLFSGFETAEPLPAPDLLVTSETNLKAALQQLLAQHAWRSGAAPYQPEMLQQAAEKASGEQGHSMMHHDHSGGHDHQSHAGHDMQQQGHSTHPHGGHSEHPKQPHEHTASHDHHTSEHPTHLQQENHPKEENPEYTKEQQKESGEQQKQGQPDHAMHHHGQHEEQASEQHKGEMQQGEGAHQMQMDHDSMNHDSMDHGSMDHGGGHDMGFMSMVMMTKHMPRSADGLAMERNEAHFGPFFPGLPGGLHIRMTLDGDTVVKAETKQLPLRQRMTAALPMEAQAFVSQLSQAHPLTPETYRLLAERALANALGFQPEPQQKWQEMVALEQERVLSHLNWLSTFGVSVGSAWLQQRAAAYYQQYKTNPGRAYDLLRFLQQVRQLPYLKQKLQRAGAVPANLLHHVSGPAARAGGAAQDVRTQEQAYRGLGFEPVTESQSSNAWGRLLVRLAETGQSVRLAAQAVKQPEKHPTRKAATTYGGSGEGRASIETPRGKADLHLHLREGIVQHMHLQMPSFRLLAMVPTVAEGQELSDALVGIASLDISPWGIGL